MKPFDDKRSVAHLRGTRLLVSIELFYFKKSDRRR